MKSKHRQLVQFGSVIGMPMAGAAGLIYLLLAPFPYPPSGTAKAKSNRVVLNKRVSLPANFKPLALNRRLQGAPPAPPKKVDRTPVHQVPKANWPNILQVDCIFWGQNSALAVVTCNNQKFRCKVGDQASTVTVEEITKDSIKVSLNGQTRVLNLASKE